MRVLDRAAGVDKREEKLKAEPLLPADDDQDWGQEVGAAAGALEVRHVMSMCVMYKSCIPYLFTSVQ